MSDDSWNLAEGDEFGEHLVAMRLLGGGTNYEAYLAFDEITYSPVVVKVVRPSQTEDEYSLRGLAREIETLGRVNHPGVVRMLRPALEHRMPHVVLEHVEGPRLSTLIRRYGPLQPEQYLPLLVDLAAALHYFRHVDVVHLDIKPSNIIMGAPARLIDMSVARPEAAAAALTQMIGTHVYMSPEQVRPEGEHSPGAASDVWGLGVTLYEAVSGRQAFPKGERGSELEVRYPQVLGEYAALPAKVPGPVREVIDSCLAMDPADRPEPHQVADAVEPVLAALPKPKLAFKVRL